MENPVTGQSEITLSIVSHGDAEKIFRMLESLESVEPERRFQILLTDNLGSELPEFESRKGRTINIIRNERPQGFGKNHNEALRRATADLYCILNPDILFTQPIFDDLISLLDTGEADITAPVVVDAAGTVQDSYRLLPSPIEIVRRKLPGYHFAPPPADADGLVKPDWVSGLFMLMKRETFTRLGGFDEGYYLYFEDVDLCTRARLLGLRIVVDPGKRILHEGQRDSRTSLTYLLWHIQSAIRFFRSKTYKKARSITA